MRGKGLAIGLRTTLAIVTVTLLATSTWAATEKKLHNFSNNGTDGTYPDAGLLFDAVGNLYGTTVEGGDYNGGTVFELSPNGRGGWTEKKLHNFGTGSDGSGPYAALIFDAAGNLYGTTVEGGNYGTGTVFELSPNGSASRSAWPCDTISPPALTAMPCRSRGVLGLKAALLLDTQESLLCVLLKSAFSSSY